MRDDVREANSLKKMLTLILSCDGTAERVFLCTRSPCLFLSDQKLPQESKMAFEEYLNREDWAGCTLSSFVEFDAVCVNILSLHLLLFKHTNRRG